MLGIVFFLRPKECKDPEPIAKAIRLYLSKFHRSTSNHYTDDEGDIFPLSDSPEQLLKERIVDPTLANACVDFRLVDGNQPPYRLMGKYFLDLEELDNFDERERVPLWFRLSQETLQEVGTQEAISFALELTDILPYSFGYMNPVLTCEFSFLTALPYLERCPGLDVSDSGAVAVDIGDSPLGPYWLNIFGHKVCNQLGGIEELRNKLSSECEVGPCGQGGVYVRLGATPQIGDGDHHNALPLHRELAALLRNLMHVPRVIYFADESAWADPDKQRAWHNRFVDS